MPPIQYVWWDDRRDDPPVRMELRPPRSLHEFTQKIAKEHDCSANAFVVALLQWAYTEDRHKRLRVEVMPSRVRVTGHFPTQESS